MLILTRVLITIGLFFSLNHYGRGQANDELQLPEQIQIISAQDFYHLIDSSTKDYHLLYSFAYWCKPCLETIPGVLEVRNTYPNLQFYPLLTEKLDSRALLQNLEVLSEKYNYDDRVFTADPAYSKNIKKRYNALIEELAPDHTDFGLSLILLLNKEKEVLYATTWHQRSEAKVEGLKKILSELN